MFLKNQYFINKGIGGCTCSYLFKIYCINIICSNTKLHEQNITLVYFSALHNQRLHFVLIFNSIHGMNGNEYNWIVKNLFPFMVLVACSIFKTRWSMIFYNAYYKDTAVLYGYQLIVLNIYIYQCIIQDRVKRCCHRSWSNPANIRVGGETTHTVCATLKSNSVWISEKIINCHHSFVALNWSHKAIL